MQRSQEYRRCSMSPSDIFRPLCTMFLRQSIDITIFIQQSRATETKGTPSRAAAQFGIQPSSRSPPSSRVLHVTIHFECPPVPVPIAASSQRAKVKEYRFLRHARWRLPEAAVAAPEVLEIEKHRQAVILQSVHMAEEDILPSIPRDPQHVNSPSSPATKGVKVISLHSRRARRVHE